MRQRAVVAFKLFDGVILQGFTAYACTKRSECIYTTFALGLRAIMPLPARAAGEFYPDRCRRGGNNGL